MKKLNIPNFSLLLTFVMLCAANLASAKVHIPSGVTYHTSFTMGIQLDIVQINMTDERVTVTGALAWGQPGRTENFSSLTQRLKPAAAMTGSFFGLRDKQPVGDMVIDNSIVNSGRKVGCPWGITTDRRVVFSPRYDCRWKHFETLFSTGITLIHKNKITVRPWAQGFTDLDLYANKPRTAVAMSKSGKLLFIATKEKVKLSNLAASIKSLGVKEAVAMDGGVSTALYYHGNMLIKPGRQLNNVILVYSSEKHISHKHPIKKKLQSKHQVVNVIYQKKSFKFLALAPLFSLFSLPLGAWYKVTHKKRMN